MFLTVPLKVKGHTTGQGPIFPRSRGIIFKKCRRRWKNNNMDRSSDIISKKQAQEGVKWNCGQVQRVLFRTALARMLVSFGWAICVYCSDIHVIQQVSDEKRKHFDESVNQTATGEAKTPIWDETVSKMAPARQKWHNFECLASEGCKGQTTLWQKKYPSEPICD